MFDLGLYEIGLVVLVAFFVMRPTDVPKLLYRMGRLWRRIEGFVHQAKAQGRHLMEEGELEVFKSKAMQEADQKEKIHPQPSSKK